MKHDFDFLSPLIITFKTLTLLITLSLCVLYLNWIQMGLGYFLLCVGSFSHSLKRFIISTESTSSSPGSSSWIKATLTCTTLAGFAIGFSSNPIITLFSIERDFHSRICFSLYIDYNYALAKPTIGI